MKNLSPRTKIQIGSLLLPGLLMFSVFTLYPIVKLFVMSFFRWNFGSMLNQTFNGIKNYQAVLGDKIFRIAFVNTLVYTTVTVLGQMALGLLVALLVHRIYRFKVSFRVVYYLPVITSWVIASLVFRYVFNTEGLLNYFLSAVLHWTESNVHWLDTRWSSLTVSMLLGIWKGIGWNMVVFLAALQSVPVELYEVAQIDSASVVQQFFYITLPGIKNTVLFILVMLTIGGFNVFTSIKLITNGQPAHQTETILTWMYYKAFSTGEFGYSAALSFIVALALAFLAALQFRLMKQQESS
ncbi:MAG: sugar ABC transporter permease [Treponema sp.]|jgi:multiple sugar transport system permease protein|nr:sugar ABC transporter permease [Treponema sp.]